MLGGAGFPAGTVKRRLRLRSQPPTPEKQEKGLGWSGGTDGHRAAFHGEVGQEPPWPRNAPGRPPAPRTRHIRRDLKLFKSCLKNVGGSDQPGHVPASWHVRQWILSPPGPALPPWATGASLRRSGLRSLLKDSLTFFSPWCI